MRTPITLACLLLASSVGAKDLIVHQRSTAGTGPLTPREETVYLAGDKIVTDGDASRTIVDLKGQMMTAMDKTKRTYNTLTFAELHAQMEVLKQTIKKLDPDTRAQFGAIFDDDTAVTTTASGKTEKIAGHVAKEYTVSGGPYSGSVWVTEEIPTPSEFKQWKKIEQEGSGAAQKLGEALTRLEGFPLRTSIKVTSGKQTMQLSNEVLEIREGSPPADMLTVPPNYTKQAPAKPAPAK
jgi:flagellar hook-associated protein FlgK